MKFKITEEEAGLFKSIDQKIKANNAALQVALGQHYNIAAGLNADLDNLWDTLITQHELDTEIFNYKYVKINGENYIAASREEKVEV